MTKLRARSYTTAQNLGYTTVRNAIFTAIRDVLQMATPRSKMILNSVGNFSYMAEGPHGNHPVPAQKREKRRDGAVG